MMNLTFGAELEFGDVEYGQPLPEGNAWNKQDYSIVNSNGIANCPIGKFYGYGGEINTKPTDAVIDQVANFNAVVAMLDPKPTVNYRTNLHIHVGIKGLKDDLPTLKKLLSYIDANQETIWALIEPIPEPTRKEYPIDVEYRGAMKRFKRRKQSHQSALKPEQIKRMLEAKTIEEFYLAHFKLSHAGVPQKHLHQRCSINLRSLWENPETIEFRHFTGTLDPKQFHNAVSWCEHFMYAAMENIPPKEILAHMPYGDNFAKFPKYVHWMEEIYERTNYHVPAERRALNIKEAMNRA